jgi:hypothetical protein
MDTFADRMARQWAEIERSMKLANRNPAFRPQSRVADQYLFRAHWRDGSVVIAFLFWEAADQRATIMKKIFLAMAIAFAITTAMTITTVIAHTDQSSAWE